MKTITIRMPDDVYREIKDSVVLRNIMGNVHGAFDSFGVLMVRAMEKGDTALTLAKAPAEKQASRKKRKRSSG